MRLPITSNLLAVWLIIVADTASAAVDNSDVLDNALSRYAAAAAGWAEAITTAATWLFWTLVLISMVWTFGMMALRKADIGEFFAEFVRFTIFTGFFWWLLTNGPSFSNSIINSLRQLGSNATGLSSSLSPSGAVDVGFAIFDKVVDQSSAWTPVNSAVGIIIAVIILVVLALVGVNMLILLVSGWFLAYAGVFFLGFGGSRWTSDMAIHYFKTVLGVASQLFAMVLIIGIGSTFLDDYYARMSEGISLKEMGVMLIVTIILLALVNKIPPLLASIVTGHSAGGYGIGNLGAGAALGAAGMATAATATGSAAISAGLTSAAGGAQAVMAAFSKANENVAAGTDILSQFSGNSSAETRSGSTDFGPSSFAQAAGISGDRASEISNPSYTNSGKTSEKTVDAKQDGAHNTDRTIDSGATRPGVHKPDKPSDTANNVVGTAARIAADASANLVQGAAQVARDKFSGMTETAMHNIAATTGGKIASAIKGQNRNSEPVFGDNSLSPSESQEIDPAAEVAAFRDRENHH